VIDAKTAHRLSQEQWSRNKRDALEHDLDAVDKRVQAAIKRGEWSCQTGHTCDDMPSELKDALAALGYTVSFGKRHSTSPVSISWGAPKESRDA
jgi:hypothetical protein